MKVIFILAVITFVAGPIYANCGNGNGNGNGCSGEQGPAGPTGPQGLPGNDGQNGDNGIDGKDGSSGQDGKSAGTRVMPVLDTAVRIYDGKYIQLQAFNVLRFADHNKRALGGSTEFMAGARIVFKLGKSHEERMLEKQQREIELLRQGLR